MAKVTWNGKTVADSDHTIIIEGMHYFPPSSVDMDLLEKSGTRTDCVWKGTASYYNLDDGQDMVEDAALYYPKPMDGSIERVGQDFTGYVAFYPNQVQIEA